MARIAAGLGKLRAQVQARCPRAPESEFGWIGDTSHQQRKSDHNPDDRGIVHALDIPHHPQLGLDCNELCATLLRVKDPRIKYVIWDEKIFGDADYGKRNGRKAWTKYSASDHTAHMHVSINVATEDDDHDWYIGDLGDSRPSDPVTPARPTLKRGSTGDDVKRVQSLLMPDGVYGAATEAAVRRFQEEQGNLTIDGMVGPATWQALDALLSPPVVEPPVIEPPVIEPPVIELPPLPEIPKPPFELPPLPEMPKPPVVIEPPPVVVAPPTTESQRLRMAHMIVDFEARRDNKGRLAIYNLPPGDGGGRYEVAGINEKYHKAEADELVALINAGKHAEAERKTVEFIAGYTDIVEKWHANPAVQCYMRDCVFNRGPTGATRILQRAVGVKDDGKWGPNTQAAVEACTPAQLLARLHGARESYERAVVGRDEKSIFWKGLVNRWDKVLAVSQTFLQPEGVGA